MISFHRQPFIQSFLERFFTKMLMNLNVWGRLRSKIHLLVSPKCSYGLTLTLKQHFVPTDYNIFAPLKKGKNKAEVSKGFEIKQKHLIQ